MVKITVVFSKGFYIPEGKFNELNDRLTKFEIWIAENEEPVSEIKKQLEQEEEEESICSYCGTSNNSTSIETPYGRKHKDCWERGKDYYKGREE